MTDINKKHSYRYKFDNWIYDSEKSTLKSNNSLIQLPKLQNDLLLILVKSPKTVFTREYLIDQLWANKIVNEEALSRLIAELRKQLSDSAKNSKYIKTLPKKGYEFIPEVEALTLLGITSHKSLQYLMAILVIALMVLFFTVSSFWTAKEKHFLITQSLPFAKRMTSTPGMERQPVISKQGNKVAYVESVNGKSHVTIENLPTGENVKIQLEDFSVISPVFSNSGKSIAVVVFDKNTCQLMTFDFDNSKKQLLGACHFKNNSKLLAWSKDDSKLYYVALENQYKTDAIWQINIKTSQSIQYTFPESADLFDSNPNISPDGDTLSFNRGNHSVQNIYTQKLNADKSAAAKLTLGKDYTVSHSWYDDDTIIYDSDKTGNRKLWLINIHTGLSHLLGARGAQYPSLSENNKKLVFQVAEYEANIWMVDLLTQEFSRVINSTKYDNNPSFNHKGDQFVFISNRQDHSDIWAYEFANQKESKLFEIPEVKLSRPNWSKDDSKLIASGNSKNGNWSYEFDLITGGYKILPFNQENFAGFYFKDEIYALSKTNNEESYLIKLDANKQTLKLPVNGIGRIMPINDNDFVFSKTNENGLFLLNINDYSSQEIIKDFPANFLNYWTVTGSDLYYINKNDNFSLWKYNIDSGSKIKVTEHHPDTVGPALSINSDQTKVLITKTDRAESDIFIVEIEK